MSEQYDTTLVLPEKRESAIADLYAAIECWLDPIDGFEDRDTLYKEREDAITALIEADYQDTETVILMNRKPEGNA